MQNLGVDDYGVIQALGVPLVGGYPLPAIIITDRSLTMLHTYTIIISLLTREDRVRYSATFRPGVARSVEETLRVVAALREVDSARGGLYTPADWEQGQPTIPSTKAGVERFYRERHGEEGEQEVGEGRVAALKDRLNTFYESIFGASTPLDKEDRKRFEREVNTIVDGAIKSHEAEKGQRDDQKVGKLGVRAGVGGPRSSVSQARGGVSGARSCDRSSSCGSCRSGHTASGCQWEGGRGGKEAGGRGRGKEAGSFNWSDLTNVCVSSIAGHYICNIC